MNARKQSSRLVLTLVLAFGLVCQSQAASYPAPTKYKQTMVRTFTEAQMSALLGPGGYHFPEMAVSSNGAKIGFTVRIESTGDKRLFVANADGTGINDVTGSVPSGKLPKDVTSLQMNDTGTRLFFRDYPSGSIYYLDTASPYSSQVALLGATVVDARKPYTLDATGNTLFLKHNVVDSGGGSHNGLYSCPVGGTPVILFNINQIPHIEWNMRYLGSGKGGPLFFTFDQDYLNRLGVPDFFMYKTGDDPTKLPNETHQYIWDEQNLPNSIVSADGSKILYGYADPSTPRQLHLVDTATGAKSFILQTSSLGLEWPNLSPDASLARISTGRLRARRIDLKTLAARDTASNWFAEYGTIGASAGLSDITLDNRRYFLASKKAADNAAIHCIDMAPTDFSQTPNITNIAFNRTFLPFDETQSITVTAQLTKGSGNLEWVHILSLWDGGEFPPEGFTYLPLWFGSDILYDNGTHGDLVAGDGIYTNNTITINKWSEFYKMNRLPKKVGLRLIAKNADSHYTIADTEFMVGNPGGLSIPATLQLLLLEN